MTETDWQTIDRVARELTNRETDVNEVQKAVAYARVQAERHSDRVGQSFFALLDTMVRDGRYLVRSGKTLDYYRDLRDVCRQYLGEYRTASGERGWTLVEILGWSVRLLRYYNTDGGGQELAERQRTGEHSRPDARQQAISPSSSQPYPSPPRSEQSGQSIAAEGRTRVGVTGTRFKVGEQVVARRVEDPKGRGRPWFQADDGFGGVVTRGQVPDNKVGDAVSLWIDSVSKESYNFSSVPPAAPRKNTLGGRRR